MTDTFNTQKLIAEFLTQGGYAPGIDADALHRETALVEAAPDLLAALETVLLAHRYDGAMTPGKTALSPAIAGLVERAIAKAKGE